MTRPKGYKHTAETKAKMRIAAIGNKNGIILHGMYQSATYSTWHGMKQRVLNPNAKGYKNYGGRGITICESWLTFSNFYADMGEKPPGLTLERVDNDGNYEPGNCQWATWKEQNNNHRKKGTAN